MAAAYTPSHVPLFRARRAGLSLCASVPQAALRAAPGGRAPRRAGGSTGGGRGAPRRSGGRDPHPLPLRSAAGNPGGPGGPGVAGSPGRCPQEFVATVELSISSPIFLSPKIFQGLIFWTVLIFDLEFHPLHQNHDQAGKKNLRSFGRETGRAGLRSEAPKGSIGLLQGAVQRVSPRVRDSPSPKAGSEKGGPDHEGTLAPLKY